ncbi:MULTISPECIES: MarR family winged helix-turn-helix transcriptional regulator [Clostridium]|uniref:MarR family winged helix-turn-helix transcriptional regulator n=1 Tax=Clostridium TaxID=1485 RepID=UPI00069EDC2F|nr:MULTISPECIES: MarR family transcriptional regulator [Clostridium]KOF58017.1 MarR family transcriptional regulator [Clostridium sp. DMHC 10]MCD2348661.1 MarR family transcriptional regulator [Clostridium guangxiense]
MDNGKEEIVDRLIFAFSRIRKVKFHPKEIDGVTHGEIMVLFCMKKGFKDEKNGIKVSQLSKKLKVAAPTVTQQINSLENCGLVKRTMDLKDRRVVRIQITEKGDRLIEKAQKGFHNFVYGLVDYLGEDESNEFINLLTKLFDYMNKKTFEGDEQS